jgi:hypothetical protein
MIFNYSRKYLSDGDDIHPKRTNIIHDGDDIQPLEMIIKHWR